VTRDSIPSHRPGDPVGQKKTNHLGELARLLIHELSGGP